MAVKATTLVVPLGPSSLPATSVRLPTEAPVYTARTVSKLLPAVETVTVPPAAAAGINCGTDCGESYPYGEPIVLKALPSTGYTFVQWTGACSAAVTDECSLTMSQARSVSAVFAVETHSITVTTPSDGTITGLGIACPGDCTESYAYGTSVTLTATPADGYVIDTWSGNCSGSASTCALTMTADKSVGASFLVTTRTLTVAKTV